MLVLEAAMELHYEGVVHLTEDILLGQSVLNQAVLKDLFLLQNLHREELIFVRPLHQVHFSK